MSFYCKSVTWVTFFFSDSCAAPPKEQNKSTTAWILNPASISPMQYPDETNF